MTTGTPARDLASPRRLTIVIAICSAARFAPLLWPLVTGRIFAYTDLGFFHVPMRAIYQQGLHTGDSLLWTPSIFSGYYAHGEGQSGAPRHGYRVDRAEREDLAFGQAVALGASCEPPKGLPDVPSVVGALSGLDAELFVVVEQDMYPVGFDVPAPVAARTREYLRGVGVGH